VELQEGSAPYRFDLALSLCALRRVDELTATLEKARKEFPEDARWAELDARCPAEP
jgi:hypothetical protein